MSYDLNDINLGDMEPNENLDEAMYVETTIRSFLTLVQIAASQATPSEQAEEAMTMSKALSSAFVERLSPLKSHPKMLVN